jgi:aspartyl-tRNA(Asn)/glutamyl-tRNA(Gln) amidotransferase subunit A
MTALTELTLTEMQRGLNQGLFSSRELVQAALERASKLEPWLHAFLHIAGESALKRADD